MRYARSQGVTTNANVLYKRHFGIFCGSIFMGVVGVWAHSETGNSVTWVISPGPPLPSHLWYDRWLGPERAKTKKLQKMGCKSPLDLTHSNPLDMPHQMRGGKMTKNVFVLPIFKIVDICHSSKNTKNVKNRLTFNENSFWSMVFAENFVFNPFRGGQTTGSHIISAGPHPLPPLWRVA